MVKLELMEGMTMAMMTGLHRQGIVRDCDLHFAGLLCRLDAEAGPELALAALLASRRTGEGHVCADLGREAGQRLGTGESAVVLPELNHWVAALRRSPIVGRPGDFVPLILDEAARLYLYRYWRYEQDLAADLIDRHRHLPEVIDSHALRQGLDLLFPRPTDRPAAESPDWQRVAAAVAVLRRFTVISGGPGTGKTATVVRILALLAMQGQVPMRTALAAPTGKAAARLAEAVGAARARLPLAPDLLKTIPEGASTIHRLLGVTPDSITFRHHRGNPLALDVLVLDEASMVDAALMAKLVAALPLGARLILLGDKDQLASVQSGAVLADLCESAGGMTEEFRERLMDLTGETLPPASPPSADDHGGPSAAGARDGAGAALADGQGGPSAGRAREGGSLAGAAVMLRHSYRFASHGAIARLAAAINTGDAAACQAILAAGLDGAGVLEPSQSVAARAADGYAATFAALRDGMPAEGLFHLFQQFRCLCALREGPAGVTGLNTAIAAELARRRLIEANRQWYAGRPIMITSNDYSLRLFNGDIGLILPDPAAAGRSRAIPGVHDTTSIQSAGLSPSLARPALGLPWPSAGLSPSLARPALGLPWPSADRLMAVFLDGTTGRPRLLPPSRLPPHETCFAMTVHKSQGSEFDRVLLVLPREDAPVLTRELLYTAVTRAREKIELAGGLSLLPAIVARRTMRSSGLRDRLGQ